MKRFTCNQISTGFYEEKNSKFYAYFAPCSNKDACETFIHQCRAQHPEAGHTCYAYRLDNQAQPALCAYSDDGEPSGTAGKPLFQPLEHGNLINVCLVVCRKYGGIQLGTGGLARAYAKAANLAIADAQLEEVIARLTREIHTDFQHEANVRHICKNHMAQVQATEYRPDKVILIVDIDVEKERELIAQLEKLNLLKPSEIKT